MNFLNGVATVPRNVMRHRQSLKLMSGSHGNLVGTCLELLAGCRIDVQIPAMAQASAIQEILSIPELEARAHASMAPMAYEYVASGEGEENTIRWNMEAYDRIALRPRVLREIGTVDTSVDLLGRRMSIPLILAPTAYHRALHPDGELATAKGAGTSKVTWVVSSATTTSIEDIAKNATSPLWFQVYMQSDRDFTKAVVDRVTESGVEALCVTVDTPVLGARNRQARANFRLPLGVTTPHLLDIARGRQGLMNPRRTVVTWKDIEWLRSLTTLPIVLKGILTPEDAELAISAGADGIIVSNHGGRNLDTLPATVTALPAVVEGVSGRVPVLVDGGIRRGTDMLKALALGARAVLVGRAYCYGLSLAGAAGVQRAVEILREELQMAMLLTGCSSVSELDRGMLWA